MFSPKTPPEKWFKSFHFILKLVGLTCYSKSDKKGRFIKSTLFDKMIFVATLCLWTTFTFFQIRLKIIIGKMVDDTQKLLFELWLDLHIVQNIFVTIIVLTSFLWRKKIETLFKILGDFDEKVSRFNWKTKSAEKLHRTAALVFGIYVFLAIVYLAACIINRWPIDSDNLFMTLNDCFVVIFYVASCEQFVVTIYEIHNRLNVLNNNLR